MSTEPVNALTDLLVILGAMAGIVLVIGAYSIGPEGIDKILTLVFGK